MSKPLYKFIGPSNPDHPWWGNHTIFLDNYGGHSYYYNLRGGEICRLFEDIAWADKTIQNAYLDPGEIENIFDCIRRVCDSIEEDRYKEEVKYIRYYQLAVEKTNKYLTLQ